MGKILAIDYGRKRIGLALSDEDEFIAFASNSVTFENPSTLFKNLIRKINELNPELIIIGQPLGLDFKPTQMSLEVDEFIKKINSEIKVNIIKWNEVGTSKLAQSNLKGTKKRDIDSESARIILQEYLDFKSLK